MSDIMSIVLLCRDEAALDEQLTIHATLDGCNTTGVNEQRSPIPTLLVRLSIFFFYKNNVQMKHFF